MADVPMFLFNKGRDGSKEQKEFIKDTKADILAVYDLLYKRGMWSKYHYVKWTKEILKCMDEETLHLAWDAIVTGAMGEVESPKEESLELYTEMKAEKMLEGKSCERKRK